MYKPSIDKIQLIRSIRLCGTPYLGCTRYTCKSCGDEHEVYLHCGNSHCMLCQNYKRLVWQSKLSSRLYNVPYCHTTFTLPKELRSLAKRNPKQLYDILFKSAWACLEKVAKKLGVRLGMVGVLHTWGSDLKYHPHIHCLVTFGGIDENNKWKWPASSRRLYKYSRMNTYYKESFLKHLKYSYKKGKINYHLDYDQVELEVKSKEWVINNAWPTENTEVIESYLSKYINRSAVSKKRVIYNTSNSEVEIIYKDYKNQKQGEPAKYISKKISPLLAIHQIVQHKLPPYYHRVRYYGLHHSAVERKIKPILDQKLVGNKDSVRILFELLSKMLRQQNKSEKRQCPTCGHDKFDCEKKAGDMSWVYANIVGYGSNKSPPVKRVSGY